MSSESRGKYRGFLRDAFALVGTTAAAKVIGLFLVPIISRLYDPDDFGVVSIVLSISMIFGVVSALRYDQAILLPEDEYTAYKLVKLSAALVMATGACLLAGSMFLFTALPDADLLRGMGVWVLAIPAITVLLGLSNVLANWGARGTQYRRIGISEVAVSVVTGGTRIASGLAYGSSVAGLVFGSLLGFVSKVMVLCGSLPKEAIESGDTGYLELAREYRDFPVYSAPTGLLNTGFQKMPVIALGMFFLPGVVGLYAMASRVGRLPIDIISLPVRRIYMQRIAELKNQRKPMAGALVKTCFVLFALGVIPFLVIGIYGEKLFGFVLGSGWAEAGVYASLLVPWLYSIFVVTPASSNYVVLKKQPLWLRIQIVIGLIGMGAFVLGYFLSLSSERVILLFSLAGMASNLGVLAVAYRMTASHDRAVAAG